MAFLPDNNDNYLDEEVISLIEYNKNLFDGVTGKADDISSTKEPRLLTDAIDFKKLTINYMNDEAKKYGYPDIFAAMSLKNSSIPELVAEGASWTDFFDAGMTFIDYEIKTGGYTAFIEDIVSVKEDPLSPKVTFTPSLTYPSVSA